MDDQSTVEQVKLSLLIVGNFVYLNRDDYVARDIDIVLENGDKVNKSARVTFTRNATKKWEVLNVLTGIKECEDDDIICRIDADDYLTDLDALAILNEAYKQTGCDVLWTMHRWGLSDFNISAQLPDNAEPYKHPWVSSHLKTFRKKLINGVSINNFKNMDGKLVQRAGDQAIYLPVLHRAKKRLFLPRVMYHYTIDVEKPGLFTCDDSKFQKAEADFIRQRGFVTDGEPWEKFV